MERLFVIAAGFASHPEPLRGNTNQNRLDEVGLFTSTHAWGGCRHSCWSLFLQIESDANDFASIIHINRADTRDLRQARHEHYVARNRHNKTGAGRKRCVSDVESPAGGRAEKFWVVRQRVLCFCHANREPSVSPI